jgi:hypothetical protein
VELSACRPASVVALDRPDQRICGLPPVSALTKAAVSLSSAVGEVFVVPNWTPCVNAVPDPTVTTAPCGAKVGEPSWVCWSQFEGTESLTPSTVNALVVDAGAATLTGGVPPPFCIFAICSAV